MPHNNIGESMQNFFEKNSKNSSNPFASDKKPDVMPQKSNEVKRLNITDMEVLQGYNGDSDIEYMEIRMNNLYKIIHNKSQNLDPITLENMRIEWETLRDKIYKEKQNRKNAGNKKGKSVKFITVLNKYFNKLLTLFKFYSPKIKEIMTAFNEINSEVSDLVKHSTPVGEEEKKYGMLVNKINQATKLNYRLTNEIK